MTPERFHRVFAHRVADCDRTLIGKSKEYARNGDRLHVFKRAAGAKGETPEEALIGMWMKQVIALTDLAQDIDTSGCAAYPVWEEKLRDVINYAILLDALVTERLESEGRI
jgi:hypothetical protein